MEQTHAPQQQASATVQAEKENKRPSLLPMDVMRSLSGADAGDDGAPMGGGRRISLSDAMQDKMQRAFGLDMSGVKLYESPGVSDAGADALAQGDTVSFAPGKADFSSHRGQALLGHEISHIASQARGEVRGGGLLENSALEARADREGELAAAGKQIAPPSAELVSAAPVSVAPVQGKFHRRNYGGIRRRPRDGSDPRKLHRFRYLSSRPSHFKPSRLPPGFKLPRKNKRDSDSSNAPGNVNNLNLMLGGAMGMGGGNGGGVTNVFNMGGMGMGMPGMMGMGGMFSGMGMGMPGMFGMGMPGMFGMGMPGMFGMGMGMPGMMGMGMMGMGGGNGGGASPLSVNVNVNIRDAIESRKKSEQDEKTAKSAESQSTESSTQTTETLGDGKQGGGGFGGGGGIYGGGQQGGGGFGGGGGIYGGKDDKGTDPEPTPPQTTETGTDPEPTPPQTTEMGTDPEPTPPQTTEMGTDPELTPPQTTETGTDPKPTPPQTTEMGTDPEPTPPQTMETGTDPEPTPPQTTEMGTDPEPTPPQTTETGTDPEPTPPQTTETGTDPEPTPKPKPTPKKKPQSGDWKLFKDWKGVKGNNNFFNTSKNLYGSWNRVGVKAGDFTPIKRSDPLHTGTINVPKGNAAKSGGGSVTRPVKANVSAKRPAPAKTGGGKPKAQSGDWRLYKDYQGVKGNNNYFNTSKNLYGAWNRVGIKRGASNPISRSDPLHTGTIGVPKWNSSTKIKRK